MKLQNYTSKELLSLHAEIMKMLKERGDIRTSNSPVSDYAEKIVSGSLGLELMPNSHPGYDAIDKKTGFRYQIKARQLKSHNTSKQLGVIRDLEKGKFDYLIAVIFDEDFNVLECYKIHPVVVSKFGRWSKHQNGYIITLREAILQEDGVENILKKIIVK